MQNATPVSSELYSQLMQLKQPEGQKKVPKKKDQKTVIDEDEAITLGGDVCNCRKSKCLKL
jgi:hypothetical protein